MSSFRHGKQRFLLKTFRIIHASTTLQDRPFYWNFEFLPWSAAPQIRPASTIIGFQSVIEAILGNVSLVLDRISRPVHREEVTHRLYALESFLLEDIHVFDDLFYVLLLLRSSNRVLCVNHAAAFRLLGDWSIQILLVLAVGLERHSPVVTAWFEPVLPFFKHWTAAHTLDTHCLWLGRSIAFLRALRWWKIRHELRNWSNHPFNF